MSTSLRFRLIAGLYLVGLLLSAAGSARAEESGPRRVEYLAAADASRELYLCILLPYRNCERAIAISIVYGGGRTWSRAIQQGERNDTLLLYADVAYLRRVGRGPSFQLGPALGFEAEMFQEHWRWRLFAAARGRLWAGQWVNFDAALGVVGAFEGDWGARGIGGLCEITIMLHGHLGAFFQTQVLYTGADGPETRVTGGFRGSFVAVAILLASMAM